MFLSLFALATGPEITLTNESHTVSVHVGLGDSGKGAGVFWSILFSVCTAHFSDPSH